MPKTKLNYQDLSNLMRSMMKTRQDNNVIDYTGVVYIENKTKLSWPIKTSAICDKQDNDVIDCIGLVYVKTEFELLGPIWPFVVCDENHIGQRWDWLYKCYLHQKWN